MNTQFWLYNPLVLFNKNNLTELWPNNNMNLNEKLNSITRLVIVLSLLGYLVTKKARMIVTGLLTLSAISILQYVQHNKILKSKVQKEGFDNLTVFKNNYEYTKPTNKNPMMNVLLPEINDNPNRNSAAPSFNPVVENDINNKTKEMVVNKFDNKKNIDNRLFKDLGDNFEFDMSMRQWYSTANTKVMNDQKAFADFCYGDMISCKEGNELACTRNAPPHWIN
jgi:hypothetical protein